MFAIFLRLEFASWRYHFGIVSVLRRSALEFKDYYEILGVARDASADDIKKAFRRLARKYHPDVSKEPQAEARMKEVNEAFAVLSDPEKRAEYDNPGRHAGPGAGFRPHPGRHDGFAFHSAGFGDADPAFSDFFSELFGRRAGGASRPFDFPGEDQHAGIALDVEDAYRGATRTITLRMPVADRFGGISPVAQERSLQVRIPRGIREGQSIRLAGQGQSETGGPPGDLYLKVRFKPHPRYRVEGRDVYAVLPVSPWEAALGATVEATVPDGVVEVRIPAGTQSGRKLRLKGRGIPGPAPGDLYLVAEVRLPPADTPRARALYETMARELDFNPRREDAH
jgi:curved DNA-binding protein